MLRREMQRRTFLTLSAAAAASAALPLPARAAVPKPYSWDASPPMDNAAAFIKWMEENRGESPAYLRPGSTASRTWSAMSISGKRATSGRSC